MGRFLNLRHPFFLPLYRRILTTAVCALWLTMELIYGGPFWALLFGVLTLWCIWEYFIAFDPANYRDVP